MSTDRFFSVLPGDLMFGSAQTVAPPNAVVGDVVTFNDPNNTKRPVRMRLVRNGTGSSITSPAGRAVVYSASSYGLVIGGFAKTLSDANFAGRIYEGYEGKTIPVNDCFWIVESGPANFEGNSNDLLFPLQEAIGGLGRTFGVYDDFEGFTLSTQWTTVGSGGTTTAAVDAANGVITLSSTATTDNACWGIRTKEMFLFNAVQPIVYEIRVKPTEHNTDDANFGFGFANALSGTVPLADNGGAAPSSGSFAYVYKVDGGTVWQFASCINSTTSNDTDIGAVVSAAWVHFRIEWFPVSATTGITRVFMDGVLVFTSAAITITSATEMAAFAIVKGGSATGTPNIEIDRCVCRQIGATG